MHINFVLLRQRKVEIGLRPQNKGSESNEHHPGVWAREGLL